MAGRPTYGVPVTAYQSTGFSDAARTRTSTPSSVRAGGSTSRSSSTPGAPYLWWTIAFIAVSLRDVAHARTTTVSAILSLPRCLSSPKAISMSSVSRSSSGGVSLTRFLMRDSR